ncbi:substrate-binding domain-containing protein [Lacibacter sp. H375]|uniref:hybrid sensor histidine kinase/response regulator transcription factor n=1 Tax=Lacibacter sp. H375 TaxID=3133424 RepID=UPI0030C3064A
MLCRKGLLVLYTLFFLLSFSSCSNRHEKKTRIGFSQCLGTDSWRKTMLAEMNRELSFHNNIELIYKNADGNSKRQIEQINELLAQEIDLLIVSPNEVNPLTPAVEKAYDSGIPVVVIDRRTSSNKYTAFIGASNFEVGQNAGRYAAAVLKGKGNVIEVTGIPDASPVIDRHKGFMDVIDDYKGINYLKRFNNYLTDSSTKNPVYQFLLANPHVDFIYAQNDYMAFDMYKICKRLGLEKKIKIIGIDGLPLKDEGLDMVANNYIDATVLYPTGGGEAILTAVNILQKKPYKKENQLFTTIIDSSNVRIMKLQNAKVLTQQEDIDRRQKIINRQVIVSKNQSNIIIAISVTLALALIFGGIVFYYLEENKKITRKLAQQKETLQQQKEEIADQRNQLIELMGKVKEATDAKFNFYTNISHELRTPLTLIMGPLEDALLSSKLHFTIKNDLEFIRRNTIRLLRLINQLMDFRKIEEGKMKLRASENNLSNFVIDITNAFQDLARKKSISFSVDSKVKDLSLWFDATMLDKVLFNLLSNAFKFTNGNGFIHVMIDKTIDGKHALIKVEDSGIGMSPEEAKHIFEMFYQGEDSAVKGTGLGLSLSKELILLHHGSISVNSTKGKGTTFEILLPIGKEHLKPEEIITFQPSLSLYEDIKIYTTDIEPMNIESETVSTTEKEHSILLIEDNEDLRVFLEQRLGQQYEIHSAEHGDKGIALAFDIIPDLIISDIILPGKNGLQITEVLKQDIRTSHIPVILLTAKGSIEEQIEGIRTQADAFVVKPFNLEYLEETIKNLIKNRAVLREHYTSELPTETRSNSANKIDRKFINQFTAIVENNIENENFSIDDICKEIGISKKQLYRKAKALIGLNINDYILTVRLQKARFLLSSEDLSISEVAFKVGFASQAYFSTVFKSKFGVSPSEFKAGKKFNS